MKLNVEQYFVDLDGNIIKDENGVDFTLQLSIIRALTGNFQDESTLSGDEKFKRWELALRVKNVNVNGDVEVSSEEVTMIKNVVAKMFGTIVVGQAWKMLEEMKS